MKKWTVYWSTMAWSKCFSTNARKSPSLQNLFFFLFCTSSSCSYGNLWGTWNGWHFPLQPWPLNSSSAGTRWFVARSAVLAAKIHKMNSSVSWSVQLCASWKRAANAQRTRLFTVKSQQRCVERHLLTSSMLCIVSHYPLLLSTSKYCNQCSHLLSCFSGGPSWQIWLCFSPMASANFCWPQLWQTHSWLVGTWLCVWSHMMLLFAVCGHQGWLKLQICE